MKLNKYYSAILSLSIYGLSACHSYEGANSTGVCADLLSKTISELDMMVISAKLLAVSDDHPEQCLVDGEINRRTGIDGQEYVIRFRLRLPTKIWNGNLYAAGGGGINGRLVDPKALVSEGYATLGTDSGHDNEKNSRAKSGGIAAFGVDPQARIDFGYNAYDVVTRSAKAVIQMFYGKNPEYSYYVGCSEGGREGLVLSQRFPEHYDGIVAGAPVLHLPLGPMSGVYTTQIFADLAQQMNITLPNGDPDIARTFSDPDLMIVRESVLNACDALDGLKDGIVNDMARCQTARVLPELTSMICEDEKADSCLLSIQVKAIQKAMRGPVNSSGRQLYADWPWDGGISGFDGKKYNMGWRSGWLGRSGDGARSAMKLSYAPVLAVLYSTPPQTPIGRADALEYSLSYNFDTDPSLIWAVDEIYNQSPADLFFSDQTNLTPFKAAGGKLIIYHGASDSSVSMNDTRNWFKQAMQDTDGGIDSFSRLYLVPGMGHCRGGPSTDTFDLFAQVTNWVERGIAPESVVATASKPEYFNVSERSRPICPFPKQAIYNGTGNVNIADSFSCK
ncbi:MAG: tannase/feruloyl esterase family alpha/beta hydrolase [Alphaproteobacteria bacterium]|nr:MAG: tannase/feruloyl esterase family alpha/beta hydrolase [Alphaproteobacteria bacterium]